MDFDRIIYYLRYLCERARLTDVKLIDVREPYSNELEGFVVELKFVFREDDQGRSSVFHDLDFRFSQAKYFSVYKWGYELRYSFDKNGYENAKKLYSLVKELIRK